MLTSNCPRCGAEVSYIHSEGCKTDRLLCTACRCDFVVNNASEPIQIIDKYTGEVTLLSEKKDMVAHPPHYQSKKGIEVIDVIEAYTEDLKGIEASDTANVIKYICRWKHKNGLEDLEKAQWYLNHLINHVKGE